MKIVSLIYMLYINNPIPPAMKNMYWITLNDFFVNRMPIIMEISPNIPIN